VFENDDRFHIMTVIEGDVSLQACGSQHQLRRGDTRLVPACCRLCEIVPQGRAVLLGMSLP
jgi:hypothetical protein